MSENQKVIVYSVVAYLFSIAVGFVWVYQFWGYEPFMWNGQFMINTNDGYFWAEGARDIIAGAHQDFDRSPVDRALPIVTALLYKIFPFSFETIIFYMSRFLASLVVIPIILIAKDLKQLEAGFIAALLSSIAWSYYNRTLVGYYDTDMLNIVLPVFLLWSLIGALTTKKNYYLLLAALDILAYRAWYPQSYALEFSFWALIGVYVLYKRYKQKEDITYEIALLSIMMLAMIQLHWGVRLFAVTAFYIAFLKEKTQHYLWYIFIASIGLFFMSGGFDPIWGKLKGYVFKDTIAVSKDELQLHFFTVMQTVREAGKIPFEVFANRISGHMSIFFLSLIGYGWLLWRYRVMLLSLPLVGLGFLAWFGGLRFTIYAIVPLAFGMGFLITEVSRFFQIKLFKVVFVSAAVLLVLAPNLYHTWVYRVPTVFVKDEVKVLDQLKHQATREDYVVSWWDYGYPIRYYSDVKTLIDGGKHKGKDNFLVSYMLTSSQQDAARLARFDVEYTEKRYAAIESGAIEENSVEYNRSIIAQMTLDQNLSDVNDFMVSLEDIKLPSKTRDIYFYLPNRMLSIFPTVARFSDINVMNGKRVRKPFFFLSKRFQKQNDLLIAIVQQGIPFVVDLQKALLTVQKSKLPVKSFTITQYDQNKKLHISTQNLQEKGINIVYMKDYNQILFLDDSMLHSSYIQMFVFEHFDPKLFEPVILTPLAKVYKLKV